MKTYITKPTSIKKSQIMTSGFSLSGKDYRFLKNNSRTNLISNYILKSYSGKEIGSEAYMLKSKHRFLKTVNLGKNFTLETSKFEYCKPINKVYPKFGDILIAKDGGGDGLGESSIYNLDNKEKIDSVSAGIIGIRVEESLKHYIFGLLKTRHFKEFIDLNTPQGSTIRHSKKIALDYQIPFPTTANHPEPQQVQDLVSVLVQNIIDKEEQIKAKNALIDQLIEAELKDNQKDNTFTYKLPKISEIKREGRMDTGLYEEKFKRKFNPILNYVHGTKTLAELKFTTKKGPNLAVSVIGQSYYSKNKKTIEFQKLILSKNVDDSGGIRSVQYIGNLKKLPIVEDGDFMLFARGDIGKVLFVDENLAGSTSNFDVFFISSKKPLHIKLYSMLFLKYLRNIKFWGLYAVQGSAAPSLTDYHLKLVKIPSFPELKQQEIANEYYNIVEPNQNLTLENYLELEKQRNLKLGIFQLNMEIFDLRDKLEDLVDRIVNEQPIGINF